MKRLPEIVTRSNVVGKTLFDMDKMALERWALRGKEGTISLTTDQKVRSSNLLGRASFFKDLCLATAAFGPPFSILGNTWVTVRAGRDPSCPRKEPSSRLDVEIGVGFQAAGRLPETIRLLDV